MASRVGTRAGSKALLGAMLFAACIAPLSGCICSPGTVRPSDTPALIAASNQTISLLFQESAEDIWARMSPSARSSQEREIFLASVGWWREALGHCSRLDTSQGFTRLDAEDGRSGIEGSMRCRGGLAPGRFVFERIDGRYVLSTVEIQIPEEVAQVEIDPVMAEQLATGLLQHLRTGGPAELIPAMSTSLGFESEVIAREATRLAAHTGPVQDITLQSRERAPHGAQEFTYVVRGDNGMAQVRIAVIAVNGILRQSGFLWRPPTVEADQ